MSGYTSISKKDPMLFVSNTALFELGLLLIELCFRKSIDDLYVVEKDRLPANKNRFTGSTRQRIAHRLIKEGRILDERGPNFETAVRRYIYCDLDQRTDDLEDYGFWRALDEKVVALLEEELEAFRAV